MSRTAELGEDLASWNITWFSGRLSALVRRLVSLACLGLAAHASADVTVVQVQVPSSIGRTLNANVVISYTRLDTAADLIQVTLPPQLGVNPPALPAQCALNAGVVGCTVDAGGAVGDVGSLSFNVSGVALGAFNLEIGRAHV